MAPRGIRFASADVVKLYLEIFQEISALSRSGRAPGIPHARMPSFRPPESPRRARAEAAACGRFGEVFPTRRPPRWPRLPFRARGEGPAARPLRGLTTAAGAMRNRLLSFTLEFELGDSRCDRTHTPRSRPQDHLHPQGSLTMSDPRRVTVTGTSSHKNPGKKVDVPHTERSRMKRRASRPGGRERGTAKRQGKPWQRD